MSELTQDHARFVRAVVEGGRKIDNLRIIRSWTRCLREHGLDPATDVPAARVSRSDLEHRQEALSSFLPIARIEITNLLRYVAGTGHAIVLCDAEGVVLNYSGDRMFNSTAKKLGLQMGGLWGEPNQGTNAPGTCLVDGEPVIVRGREHYLAQHTGLHSVSAPILDPQGKVIAALAICGEADTTQEHTLVLARMTAETIENRYLLSLARNELVIRFHNRPDFIKTPGEALLSVNGAGRSIAVNRSAAFQLGYSSPSDMLGKDIGELFNVTVENIAGRGQRTNAEPHPLYETRHGRRFYALVRPSDTDHLQSSGSGQARTAAIGRSPQQNATFQCLGPITLEDLEFGDETMAENIRCANRILNHDIPILLYGETGTGKELFSKALHNASNRAGKPYVAVNCAAIPETLIESELFGYKGGAFTGARREGNRGKIVQANGGTLFLDEIGDMPLALQGRLLRVLEEREVLPLGSDTPVKVDIRLVSATHRHLPIMISNGEFREDLYYRLEGVPITLPPLRERQDRRQLIRRMVEIENNGVPVRIEERAMDRLVRYRWPGNLRQLGNVLRTLLALREGDTITYRDLPPDIRKGHTPAVGTTETVRHEAAPASGQQPEAHPPVNPLKGAERDVLLEALESNYWNITRIARRFNVSRNTIYRKMKAHNIRPPRAG